MTEKRRRRRREGAMQRETERERGRYVYVTSCCIVQEVNDQLFLYFYFFNPPSLLFSHCVCFFFPFIFKLSVVVVI